MHLPNWIGDTVMSLPSVESAARWAREAPDEGRLTLLGRRDSLSLTENIPGVAEKVPLPPRPAGLSGVAWLFGLIRRLGGRFDAALTLSPSFSSAVLLYGSCARIRVGWAGEGRSFLLNRLWKRKRRGRIHLSAEFSDLIRSLGIPEADDVPALRWADGELDEARRRLAPLAGRAVVALAPGAVYGPTKRWPLERFKGLGRQLTRRGLGVVWIGGPAERGILSEWLNENAEDDNMIDLMGVLALRQSAAVLALCRATVANDSGALHLAQAAGSPTVALFGSTEPRWTGPLGKARVLRNPVFCSPCFLSRCPHDLECWKGIEVDHVLKVVEDFLEESAEDSREG
jgi:heptosyltransferase-2